ncbi:HD domain-containing phosphohydrolase [Desulfitobacterium metallireducens]|uniref:HD domain-containing phosphohydrolase n=1 Tax=Desulfitobacterium metallireducens TaxID=142877 RepID=UPI001FA6FB4F|nr:HD domain-containing phosphohydrolase [Desulfitobacterium metallireducens]
MSTASSLLAAQQSSQSIQVVIDENYPPYSFRNSQGELQGISIDQWKLFEQKTGIKVYITGKPWNEAYESMLAGQFDVIDTISYSEQRTTLFDFTKPYATIEVPIFFQNNISGIHNADSIRGFEIAAKKGDHCIEVLNEQGITNITEFDSAEDLIQAAKDNKISIFTMGKPPALYYLYKMGIQDNFHYTDTSLYTSQFYRAVKVGNTELLNTLESGFDKISDQEMESINARWLGISSLPSFWAENFRFILFLGFVGILLLFGLFYWNRTLNRKVIQRTQEINEINCQLEYKNNLLQAIFESSPDVLVCSLDKGYCYLNFNLEHKDMMLKIFGSKIEVGMNMLEAFGNHPYAQLAQANFKQVLAGDCVAELQDVRQEENGTPLYWQMYWSPIVLKNGEVVGISSFVINISELKQTEKLLRDSEYLLLESQRVAHTGSYIMDYKTGQWHCSQTLNEILGIEESFPHTLEGYMTLIHPDWLDLVTEHFQLDKECYDFEYQIVRHENGEVRWVHGLGELEVNSEGEPLRMIGTIQDVTDHKKNEERILYLSYHDQLTGLYNRRFYEEELKRLDVVRNYPLSVMMADVNGLKLVNDSFGHEFGDQLLSKVGQVMKKACRKDDILARLGGDEFVLLLPNTDRLEAERILKRIQKLATQEEVGSIQLSISFGFETKRYSTQSIDEILKKAEDNMYKMKLFESPSMRGKAIQTIVNTLYEKNKQEEHHSHSVSELCQRIGIALNLPERDVLELKNVGLLHDIGKIGIDEKVLSNSGKLTKEEWIEIKRHPEIGYRILSTVNDMADMAIDVLAHHERWDGNGYPKGLKGNKIPLHARIIAIADAYDAMINDRSYRKPFTQEKALEELTNNAGTQFDPELVKIFIDNVVIDLSPVK